MEQNVVLEMRDISKISLAFVPFPMWTLPFVKVKSTH